MIHVEDLKQKMEFIKKHDPACNFFGAQTHRYVFNKCLSEDGIKRIESENNIQLPPDYRAFIATIGDGGPGPGYGLLSLQEAMKDFKLISNPYICLKQPFKYTQPWNASWIYDVDWDEERPDATLNEPYMDVSHIHGTLQLSHTGYNCSNLLVVNGKETGNVWFDGRADYSGIFPETIGYKQRVTFSEWYMQWVDKVLEKVQNKTLKKEAI
jgi:hypothetical protein